MPTGPIPTSQLNALPILTAGQAALGGDVLVVGSTLSRVWSPATLGLNGTSVVANKPVGWYWFGTDYLDLRGTSKCLMTVRCVNVNVRAALPVFAVWLQTRQGPTDKPDAIYSTGGGTGKPSNAETVVQSRIAFPATANPSEVQTAVFGWSFGGACQSVGTDGNYAAIPGINTRIIFSFETNFVAPANVFYVYLEASS